MNNLKAVFTATAALGVLVGLPSIGSAGSRSPSVSQLQQESVYTQQGDSSGPYLFTANNNTSHDIWVTFYDKAWYGDQHTGEACIPPGKSGGIASSAWAQDQADIQVEVKAGAHCQGSDVGKANLLSSGVTVVQGGTSRVTISNDSNPQASFVQ